MADGTKIEWTHRPGTIPATMNALVGCQKVSDGCRNCYAIDVAHVRAGNPLPVMQEKFGGTTKREGGKTLWTGKVTLTEKALLAPLHAKKPHTYFVNSMSDLFYDGVPDEWIDRHFAVFALCPQHTFIVLTKRPERMRAYMAAANGRINSAIAQMLPLTSAQHMNSVSDAHADAGLPGNPFTPTLPLPNVWLGVSVENQATADARILLLLQTPAAIRFLSCEPLLGDVDLRSIPCELPTEIHRGTYEALAGTWWPALGDADKEYFGRREELPKLDWVIAGGESGHGARPMHPDWARGLREECAAAGVPFFFKQWGEMYPCNDGDGFKRIGKKAAGHLLDGIEHHAFPEVR